MEERARPNDPTRETGADPASRVQRLESELARLTSALEDVVALAHTSGESRQRVALMERRAMAALSGKDQRPPDGLRDLARVERGRPEDRRG